MHADKMHSVFQLIIAASVKSVVSVLGLLLLQLLSLLLSGAERILMYSCAELASIADGQEQPLHRRRACRHRRERRV